MSTAGYRAAVAAICGSMLAHAAAAGEIRWRSATLQTGGKTPAEVHESLIALTTRPTARHLVVQFEESVGPDARAALEIAGLRLQSYVGNRAYFASLSAKHFDVDAIMNAATIVDALSIERDWKLHPMLAAGREPAWAVVARDQRGDATVGAYVLFHDDVALRPDGVNVCQRHGAVTRSEFGIVNGLVIELPFTNIAALADEDAVQWIEPALPRLGEVNDGNRALVQADIVQAVPYSLDGAGVSVLVYDGGTALASHADFGGRLTQRDASGVANHATHVAGTIGGNGSASAGVFRGMARGVTLESYGFEDNGSGIILYTDPGDIQADYNEAINAFGCDIANNSIGSNIVLNGFSCDLMGDYGITDMVIDSIVRGSLGQPFRVIWANGNERQDPSTCGTGYNTTGPPACAKNHITVGATNSNDDSMTGFSSWGPADDGRVKPDLVAPGCQADDDMGVTSCSSAGGYDVFCGTSMAAPTVTGISALLIEDFRAQFPSRPDPRNSTLKILLAQTAVDLGNVGPDYQFGYGSVRIQDAVDFMRTGNFLEGTITQGESLSFDVIMSPGEPELKITLAWDDWPGTPNVVPSLVNDVDLVVLDPKGAQHFPWILDPVSPATPATRDQADHTNNIEQVVVDAPMDGTWTVEIVGFDVPLFPQTFSLCASAPIVDLFFTKAISRAYTVTNVPMDTPEFNEAVSRSVTVINVPADAPIFGEAISRSYTVINTPLEMVEFSEALSRSYTVINVPDDPPVFDEAISRAYTVYNQDDLGDLDGDGFVTGGDIGIFVAVLLGGDTDPAHVASSDMNCDGFADDADLPLFVGVLLQP